ncbi:MAG TPA: glycosyltransferase family 4 protein [Bacteroidales bacterium]|nr:glycosyltransferase family 4 protein [Bacteroidales bacterium]
MKILYILSSYNVYGGTPKKTLDLMRYFGENSVLYVYNNVFQEFKESFESTGAKVFEGFYSSNLIKHLRTLLLIIDEERIDIVQTQFSLGEGLGFLVKLFRPKTKVVVCFVGANKPGFFKSILARVFYRQMDVYVFISKYIKEEKIKQFPILKKYRSEIIYNGAELRVDEGEIKVEFKKYAILDIAGLIELKNLEILVKAINLIIKKKGRNDIYLYIAGDGPQRTDLEALIKTLGLQEHIILLGYKSNVGFLLNSCDIFVHPSYAEGFGIVVAEAMLAEKPVIVSDAGALPELIQHEYSGLVIDPFDEAKWADAIIKLLDNPDYSKYLAHNAKLKAETEFSIEQFASQYNELYMSLIC